MNILEIIEKKKNKCPLQHEEINYFVSEYTRGNIPDYQMSALLMAITINGLTKKETYYLTKAMTMNSKRLFTRSVSKFVDKHSTGGIGDKLTMICIPIVASVGVPIIKMSGRGLGYAGGTVDKLESIPGFSTGISSKEIKKLFTTNGVCLCSNKNVKSDEKIYQLRDVTGTIESIPLIASSIMSKKIVTGCYGVVIDIKIGKGALIKTQCQANNLADYMIYIAEKENIKIKIHFSIMNEPLGYGIGNAIEVIEAINVLQNKRIDDVVNSSLEISANMCEIYGCGDYDYCYNICKNSLESGKAFIVFKNIIEAQGGDIADITYEKILCDQNEYSIISPKSGLVRSINSENIGKASLYLGAGRIHKNDNIDSKAGIILSKKIGDTVAEREIIARIYYSRAITLDTLIQYVTDAYEIN